MTLSQKTELIIKTAHQLGFELCGISKIIELDNEKDILINYINKGYNADLKYLENNIEKRANPKLLVENSKSIISVGISYNQEAIDSQIKISKYAYGKDYHIIIKNKLIELIQHTKELIDFGSYRIFTDSAPVFDKKWANNAGFGWFGKNSCLINKKLGSFFFIGEIICEAEFEYSKPFDNNYCGNCTKCIDSCPTKAIESPYTINAKKCISYHNIENKNEIPENISQNLNGWIFGCDICQDVCPWNKNATETNEESFRMSENIKNIIENGQIKNITEEYFNEIFKQSPFQRAGYKKIKSNIKKNSSY